MRLPSSTTAIPAKESAAPPRKRRILLVDDHPIVREGFAQLINTAPDLEVCGQAGNSAAAISEAVRLDPDLAIVDLSLGNESGLDLIRQLKPVAPRMAVLVLSMFDERIYARRAIRAGATGFVMKQSPTEEVMDAIRSALDGAMVLKPSVVRTMIHRARMSGAPDRSEPSEVLTDRELEIFRLYGEGEKRRDIAANLKLSVRTVDVYRDRIRQKLGLNSVSELTRFAVEWAHGRV